MSKALDIAVAALRQGQLIAYPVETVYSLGCDPFNEAAVLQLCQLKQRSIAKGLILIAANWQQLAPLVAAIEPSFIDRAMQTWPGPYTWVFPASNKVPSWVRGDHDTVALRITDHLQTQQLCKAFGGPIITTSANLNGQTPINDPEQLAKQFNSQLAYILEGELGPYRKPTEIRDVMSNQVLRA